jgi:hypothetical protein
MLNPENRGPSGGGPFGASGLCTEELAVERAREARNDFVLHVEEVGERLIEPLGVPESLGLTGTVLKNYRQNTRLGLRVRRRSPRSAK